MNKALKIEIKSEYDLMLQLAGFKRLSPNDYLIFGYPDRDASRIIVTPSTVIIITFEDDEFHLQIQYYKADSPNIRCQADITNFDLANVKGVWLMQLVIAFLLCECETDFKNKCELFKITLTQYDN